MIELKTWWAKSKTWQHILLGAGLVLGLYFVIIFMVRLGHYGKLLPGISLRGVYVGGLTKPQAIAKLDEATARYMSSDISYQANGQSIAAKPASFGISFDNKAFVDEAFKLGRDSDILSDIAAQTSLLFGGSDITQLGIDGDVFSKEMVNINNSVAKPSQNAEYLFEGGKISVSEAGAGQNIDMGWAMFSLTEQFNRLDTSLTLPISSSLPNRTTEMLIRQKDTVANIAKTPLALTYDKKSWTITQQQLVSWVDIDYQKGPLAIDILNHYFHIPITLNDFSINKQNVINYLAGLAGEINQPAIDAALTISGGRASIFKQSRDGKVLNTSKTADAIIMATESIDTRTLSLVVDTQKAEVADSNIDNLGIKELIGEGVTYFPGSSAARLQNVRVGAAKFNGILLKPDQVFSFGEYLGDVGPEQGYAEGLIILDNHVEKAYGGGLCQVSSTAYRAALLSGLPIVERTNHSFAISYYTAPFGVPGVDATIYYPQVDMKFKNDTGHYILIQTEMVGTTLKFSFYGTKTKTGVINGPSFVYGSNDETKPSQTVFYRQVLDLSGNIIKTDTINTYYKSSLDFPVATSN